VIVSVGISIASSPFQSTSALPLRSTLRIATAIGKIGLMLAITHGHVYPSHSRHRSLTSASASGSDLGFALDIAIAIDRIDVDTEPSKRAGTSTARSLLSRIDRIVLNQAQREHLSTTPMLQLASASSSAQSSVSRTA
jgi:hypothetical protein